MSEEIQENASEAEDIQISPAPDALDIQDIPEIQDSAAASSQGATPPAAPSGSAAKRRGRPTGSRNKPKIVAVPVEPEPVAEVAPPPQRRKRATVAPQHTTTYVEPEAPEPPWAQHESAAAYLEQQLRALKNHRQLAKHEMWGQLIRDHW